MKKNKGKNPVHRSMKVLSLNIGTVNTVLDAFLPLIYVGLSLSVLMKITGIFIWEPIA